MNIADKIIYVQHAQIDKVKWNLCIHNSTFPILYGLSWYLDCVSPGWDALVMGDYRAVMPLPVLKKFGISVLAHPFYSQQLGVFSAEVADISYFLKHIPHKFAFGRLQLNESNQFTAGATRRIDCHLSLNANYEQLRKGYNENTRRNINKSLKNNLLQAQFSVDELIRFKTQNSKITIKPQQLELFRNLLKTLIERGYGYIQGLKLETGEPAAMVFWLHSQGRYIYLSANSSPEGTETRAMFRLLDDFIRLHAGEKDSIIDFEGSGIESVRKFYTGFGAHCVYFPEIQFYHHFGHFLKLFRLC